MKKFLTFMLLCLMSIAAWAEEPSIDTSKHYYIKNVDADKYVVLNNSGNATISANNKTLFTIEGSGSSYTIKSGNTYLSASGWDTQPSTESFTWTIDKTEDGLTFYQEKALKGFLGIDKLDEGEKLYCNKGASHHPYFVLVLPEEKTYTVHITGAPEDAQVTFGDKTVSNNGTLTATGLAAEDITPAPIANYTPAVLINNTDIYVYYQPIKNGTWYIREISTGLYAKQGKNVRNWDSEISLKDAGTTFEFAIAEDGLYTIKTTGRNKGNIGGAQLANPNNNDHCMIFDDINQASNYFIKEVEGGYKFGTLTNDKFYYIGVSTNDNLKKALIFTEEESNAAVFLLMEEMAPTTTVTYEYYIGDVKVTSVEKQLELGTTVKAPENPAFLSVVSYEKEGENVTEGMVIKVTCTENLPFPVTTNESNPVWGVLHVHSNQDRFLYAKEDGKIIDSTNKDQGYGWGNYNKFNQGYYWYITGSLTEGFHLHNMAVTNGTVANTSGQASITIDGDAFKLYAPQGAGSKFGGKDIFCLSTDEGQNYMNVNSKGVLTTWEDNDAGSTFYFEEKECPTSYTLSIGSTGYSTIYLEENAYIPEDVTIYCVTKNEGTGNYDAVLYEDPILAPWCGFIVEGNKNTESTFTYTTEEPTNVPECVDELYGVPEETTIEGSIYEGSTIYVLSSVQGQIGFYKFGGESLKANRAFLVADWGATEINGFSLDFGGQTVGVNSVISAANLKAGYDIQGRKLNKIQKGINILNGKKIIK